MSHELRVAFGGQILDSDGRAIGTVARAIGDHGSGRLRAVAVRLTDHHHRLIEVPLANLRPGPNDALELSVPATALDQFADYHEENYTSADDELAEVMGASPEFLMVPGQMGNVYLDTLATPSVQEVEASHMLSVWAAQQAEANTVVGARTHIHSSDDVLIGTLHEVDFTEDGRVRRFTVQSDYVLGGPITLPITTVARVDDDSVVLKQSTEWLQGWASIESGMEVWTDDNLKLGTVQERQVDSLLVLPDDSPAPVRVPLGAVSGVAHRQVRLTVRRAMAAAWTQTK
jgi:hypothetical protein